MNTKYEVRVYPNTPTETQALVDLGFSRDWDNSPMYLRTDNWEDVDVVLNVLAADGFTCNYQLEKKEDE